MSTKTAPKPAENKVDHGPRCWRCGRCLAHFVARPWRLQCGRCRAENASPKEQDGPR